MLKTSNAIRLFTATSIGLAVAIPAQGLTDLGPGELFLDVSGGLTWDSNVYASQQETGDFIWNISPSLSYVQNRGLIHLTASLTPSYNGFSSETDQSGTDLLFNFNLTGMHRDPAPDMNFSLSGNYADEKQASNEVANRIDIQSYGLSGTMDHNFSDKTGIRLGAGWSERDFDDVRYFDSETISWNTAFLYHYSPKVTYNVGYAYQEIQQQTQDFGSDSITVGVEGVLSPKLSGSANVGINDSDSAGGAQQLTYGVGLDWKYDTNTSFSLNGSRGSTPSATGEGATSTDLTVSVSQRFTDLVSGGAYIGIGYFDRIGEQPRNDTIYSTGASVSRRIGTNASISASVSYEDRNSNIDLSNFDRVTASVNGSIRF